MVPFAARMSPSRLLSLRYASTRHATLRHPPSTFIPPYKFLWTSARRESKCCSEKNNDEPRVISAPMTSREFWASTSAWKRASVNTLRCLIGCTMGDFASLWFLQAFHPSLGMGTIMAISMASGLSTSMMLETTLLRYSRDRLSWPVAAKTAAGMSFISMLTMEMVQNITDYHLTGGIVDVTSLDFWIAAAISMGAGYLAPLPYNYVRLRKYGKACH
ncbi:Uncharacterized protein SAPIO_CDS4218 [Scedosporium apiospermum]|uniref:DUF4396 domain-containing protein n=1 Tax=Pseudallescheria apiosperma TaxID=563466 RepID=A0A084G8G1_PSEDA|nr:Uncharacterized protein SAPIO_CDS4218 [Scedosporium apiospermum]KEZ43623.1 Uncharacterized protein SAPIO_CDS4218 [Scedosporium apiospermum]